MTPRIRRYQILSRLGAGGAGEVWEAVLQGPAGFRKRVAVKVVPPGHRDAAGLRQEARLGALLRHPNVVDVYELGETEDGRTFLAMELVPGPSLGAVLRARGPLPGPALRDIGIQLARGLAYVHTTRVDDVRGLVHRDIKPSNLLLDPAGVVKIADLGIARLTGTAVDVVEGTPGFLAPEQLEGRLPLPSADVYSAGMVLWAMAAGHPPVKGGKTLPAALKAAVGAQQKARDAAAALAVVPGLLEVVARCLAPDPASRYADGQELLRALRELPEPAGEGLHELLAGLGPLAEGGQRPTTDRTPHTTRPRPEQGPLFGRTREREALLDRIRVDGSLTTLKGLAGIGKSRLAAHVAHAWAQDGGEVVWVELSAVEDRDGIQGAVAAGLGTHLGVGDPMDRLADALRARPDALLVLDGADRCGDALVGLVGAWQAAVPELRVLTTRRAPTGASGEVVVELGPLAADAALALFEHQLGHPTDPATRATVVDVLRRLDHHPLAVQLAAARAGQPGAPRVDALAIAGEDPLRQAVALAWDPLPPWSRRALTQLTAFRGTFTVNAAEAVVDVAEWPEAPWPVDVIDDLWRRSLLYVRTTKSGPRLGVFDAVAAQALAAEVDPHAAEAAHLRHGAWFARFGDAAWLEGLRAREGEARLRAMARDLEDLLAASERAQARGDREVAVATGLAAATVLCRRGPWSRAATLLDGLVSAHPDDPRADELHLLRAQIDLAGIEAIDAAIALAPTPRRRARAESRRVVWLSDHGEMQRARDEGVAALERARASGDQLAQAEILLGLGIANRHLGLPRVAESTVRESLRIFTDLGDLFRASSASQSLGNLLYSLGRRDEAAEAYLRAEEGFRTCGARHAVATALTNLSMVDAMGGDPRAGERRAREALGLCRQLGDVEGEADACQKLGMCLGAQGRLDEAAEVQQRAAEVYRRAGLLAALAFSLCNRGHVLHLAGRPAEARALFEEATQLGTRMGSPRISALAMGNLAVVDADLGRLPSAHERILEAIDLARGVDPRFEGAFLVEEARIAMARGLDPAPSLARARELLATAGSPVDRAQLACAEAAHLAATGRHDEARARLDTVDADIPEVRSRADAVRAVLQG